MGDAPAWNRPARPVDFDDAKGITELVARRLGLAPAWRPLTSERVLHPGRAARLEARDAAGALKMTGRVGELHPGLVEDWDLRTDHLIVAELSIAGLSGGALPPVRSQPPGRFQASDRDLAIVVEAATPAAAVEDAIRVAGGELLRHVALFDIYTGPPLAAGERSLAWRLTFAAPDRTLAEAEIEAAVAAVTASVASVVGGRIRS
jgi:phenylalanyl-tRNA synthetase beta chain